MAAVPDHDEQGNLIRRAGIMSIVLLTGEVRAGDTIRAELPPEPHQRLQPIRRASHPRPRLRTQGVPILAIVKYDHSIRPGHTPALH
jgi:MOSC domain-containing protein YiiM